MRHLTTRGDEMTTATKKLIDMTEAELIEAHAECNEVIGNSSRYFDQTIVDFRAAERAIRDELKRRSGLLR
jgi:hypothetical protein